MTRKKNTDNGKETEERFFDKPVVFASGDETTEEAPPGRSPKELEEFLFDRSVLSEDEY